MALKPIAGMAAASLACCLAVLAVAGGEHRAGVVLGMLGPLAGAAGTWLLVERRHASAPERLTGVMIKLLAAKVVLFGAYVAAVVLLHPAGAVAFVSSFTSQYIMLHLMEALYLRRLFTGGGAPLES